MLYLVKQTLKILELLESILHILTPELSYIIADVLLFIDEDNFVMLFSE